MSLQLNLNGNNLLHSSTPLCVNILIGYLIAYEACQLLFSVTANDQHQETIEDAWIFENRNASDKYSGVRIYLTVSALRNYIEISWESAPAQEGDRILLTTQRPHNFTKVAKDINASVEGKGKEGSGEAIPLLISSYNNRSSPYIAKDLRSWLLDGIDDGSIILALDPLISTQWFTTRHIFNPDLDSISLNSKCYGYWASYVNSEGDILAMTCYRIFPTWMNDIREVIGNLKINDLLIPGTHDSGSYRRRQSNQENIFVKYSITQDDNVYTQLLNGIRYLDLRIGYYRDSDEEFYINHGITKQKPLSTIIEQIKKFVTATNEIVIVGFKEFPIGFGRNLTIHNKLVEFLRINFNQLSVNPSLGYTAKLNDIWETKRNIILAYDKPTVVMQNPDLLFPAVEQRWANAQTWPKLEEFLHNVHYRDVSISFRPVADMAELTPDAWGVVTDRYGGLRVLADMINWRISLLYRYTFATTTNIVAMDFYRGTTIINLAMELNRRLNERNSEVQST